MYNITMSRSIKGLIKFNHLLSHETKRKVFIKFILVLLVFVSYALYVIFKFGAKEGISIAFLTWSFFVLSTPVADAGFLLDFPIRLITSLKMWLSEIFVWLIAISLNLYFYFFEPEIYQSTVLLKIFYTILSNPYPYWSIIFLSGLGTFLSIYLGDVLLDKVKHHEINLKNHNLIYSVVASAAVFSLIFFAYYELLHKLNIHF